MNITPRASVVERNSKYNNDWPWARKLAESADSAGCGLDKVFSDSQITLVQDAPGKSKSLPKLTLANKAVIGLILFTEAAKKVGRGVKRNVFRFLDKKDKSKSKSESKKSRDNINKDGDIIQELDSNVSILLTQLIAACSTETFLNTKGIFRLSASKRFIEDTMAGIIKEGRFDPANFHGDSIDMACILKFYVREHIQSGVIPACSHNQLDEAALKDDVHEISSIISRLDDKRREILKLLLNYLSLVSSYSAHNGMTPSNLAIVFGPSMLPQDTTHIPIDQLAIAMERPADIMLCLLNNVTLLFAQVEENIATSKKDIEEDYDYEVVNPAFCLSQIVDQDNQEAELASLFELAGSETKEKFSPYWWSEAYQLVFKNHKQNMEELEKLINARGREIKELQEGSLGSPSDKITAMKNSRQAVVKNNIESILTGIPREYLDSSIWWRTMVMEYEQCCFSMEQLMTRQAMTQLIKINKLKTQKETL